MSPPDRTDESFEGPTDPMLDSITSILAESGITSVPPDVFGAVIREQSSQHGKRLLRELNRARPAMIAEHRKLREQFERRLHRSWGTALDKLEMLIVCSHEAGEEFNERWRRQASIQHDVVFDVLVRLHARSVRTAREILALLSGGYAAGAHARWRTLHEIAVVGFIIGKHGNETAERYLLHADIESYKAMLQYQQYCSQLGMQPLTSAEVQALEDRRELLLDRFGKDFRHDYGWAAAALGKKRVSFADLEEAAGLIHFRPWYRMSSDPIHAGPKALSNSLGSGPAKNMLLTGASNGGLADPGHSTAISLAQITVALISREPWIKDITVGEMILALVDEIGEAFLRAHRRWEKRAGVKGG